MSRMPCALLALLLLLAPASLPAHDDSPLPVIVDTDMALDDIRAIVLLCQDPRVELVAAISSDGASDPATGAAQLRRLLVALDRRAVPVGAGRALVAPAPPWRPLTGELAWPTSPGTAAPPAPAASAATVLAQGLAARGAVSYLCLGPLTNLADLLDRDPDAAGRLAAVVYSGSGPQAETPSWNTARDLAAARRVFAAGLPLRSLQFADDQLPRYDTDFAGAVCAKSSAAAALLCALHATGPVSERVRSGHFRCWDEAVALQFLYPELLSWTPDGRGRLEPSLDPERMRQRYLDLLAGDLSLKTGHRQPVVLRAFPRDASALRADVAAIAAEALARHGAEEWNSILLTNELHRHLGIYSILGAKMGIRARELLGAGLDEVAVVSLCGNEEPLSCLTDGLQVATGATLGRGSISVSAEPGRAAAIFSVGERSLELALKPEIVARIRADIQRCIAEQGALTPAYWEAVRALALRYWLEMDRAALCVETWRDASATSSR